LCIKFVPDFFIIFFQADTSEEVRRIININSKFIKAFPKLAYSIPWYKILPNPRWNRTFRDAEDSAKTIVDWSIDKIQQAKARILAKADKQDDSFEVSVLEKLIIKNGFNSSIPVIMAFDMIVAGIDTTSNTAAFLLYHLAK